VLQLAFVISTIYWSLVLFFPTLILRPELPKASEPTSSSAAPKLMIIPFKTDLALHATPLLTLLFDFFVFERKFTKAQISKGAPAVVLVYGIWYASLVEYCATFNGACESSFLGSLQLVPRRVSVLTRLCRIPSPIPVLDTQSF
jgi:hypothetical protein